MAIPVVGDRTALPGSHTEGTHEADHQDQNAGWEEDSHMEGDVVVGSAEVLVDLIGEAGDWSVKDLEGLSRLGVEEVV